MKQTTALKIANFLEGSHIFVFIFTFIQALGIGFILSWLSHDLNPLFFCMLSACLVNWCCMITEKILVIHYKFEDHIYEGYVLQGEGLN